MLSANYLLALSISLLPIQVLPDKWLLIGNTENSVLEVSNNSISIDKHERTVEFVLRSTMLKPVELNGSSVKMLYNSVIVMCHQRAMVVMSQYGNDAAGAKTYENFSSKVFRFTENRATVSDNVISITCKAFSDGESERSKPSPRSKPGTVV